MTTYNDKYSAHGTLIAPIKLFGFPKAKDKLEALEWLKDKADAKDIEVIFPLVFDKNAEISSFSTGIIVGVMQNIKNKRWNSIYDEIKYSKVDIESLTKILNFPDEISVNLLGVASLNSNGYVREKALRLLSGIKNPSTIPYILLRLNDWVTPIREIAVHIIKNTLSTENIDSLIENFYLINKLQNVVRIDLKSIRDEIIEFLREDKVRIKIKTYLKQHHVKTRLFCYMLLENAIPEDDSIIKSALRDRSFEVRLWLINMIKKLNIDTKVKIIGQLLDDKSSKVVTQVIRNFEQTVSDLYREKLAELACSKHSSIRDEVRFVLKQHAIVTNFAEFYKKEIEITPKPGAIMGLGETGNKTYYSFVSGLLLNDNYKLQSASINAMWHLSPEESVNDVLWCLDSDIPSVRKMGRKLLKKSRMPTVVNEMKTCLNSDCLIENKLFVLDLIFDYNAWVALESLLSVISKEEGKLLDKAKYLLEKWVIRSARLYTKPDSGIKEKINILLQEISGKKLLSEGILKELNFAIKTRI